VPGLLEDFVSYLADEAFGWLIIGLPVSAGDAEGELAKLRRQLTFERPKSERDERLRLQSEHAEKRFRELSAAVGAGLWEVHVLVGAADEAAARRIASVLCAAADPSDPPYLLQPGHLVQGLETSLRHGLPGGPRGASPFLSTTSYLATLARPPRRELPGFRAVTVPTFDTTPELPLRPPPLPGALPRTVEGATQIGFVLDASLRPVQPLTLTHKSLNRHTFVCGATGSGKSQTVRTLLQGLSLGQVPWLVIESAKAEYAGMAGRLGESGEVLVIRPGDPDAIPASLNPLEPSADFALQTHVDLVRALFLAAFQAEEPFPQILSAALTRVYEHCGWDLVTGRPRPAWARDGRQPRYPALGELRHVAREVVRDIGYSEKVTADVLGFIDVRIGSLTTGSPGRFFQGGHPLDVAALLRSNVVVELEGVATDTDKAFLIGVTLIRIYEQLQREHARMRRSIRGRLRHVTVVEEAHRLLKRPQEASGSTVHALELFANLLAEIRAYGEGIVVAEQIPVKILPDVIKNSAVKIVHRLPAADDRDIVGATINLTKEQSDFVVTLPDGIAAVFADGMDRPVLTALPDNEWQEGGKPVTSPPVARPRSAACPTSCRGALACNLAEIRAAERLSEAQPRLAFYLELAAIAHVLGKKPPVPVAAWLDELRRAAAIERRVWACAIAHLVEQAVGRRYGLIVAEYRPDDLVAHLAIMTEALLWDRQEVCTPDDVRFAVGKYRGESARRQLASLPQGTVVSTDLRRQWQQQGLRTSGNTAAEVLTSLVRPRPWGAQEETDLLLGTPRTTLGVAASHELLAQCSNAATTAGQLSEVLMHIDGASWSWTALRVPREA
jgi:hypothetical protein